jgi:hypothetical protein|tara:strand:+ start:61 stop:606 length:546 start_codon:yes stop_codon:yes gene_type:complete
MTQVTKEDKAKWGNYSDRKDSFDDDADYEHFIQHTRTNKKFQQFLLKHIPKGVDCKWKSKPDGPYGIDLALVDIHTGKKLLCIDLERWSAWKNEWPSYYRYLHFLGRKDHFLEEDEPFLMVFFEYNRNKFIVCEKETIKQYTTFNKHFKAKDKRDDVKQMKMSDGYIFGNNITSIERNNFT